MIAHRRGSLVVRIGGLAVAALLIASGCVRAGGGALSPEPALVYVVFETELGDIEMELDTQRAPITCAGFLQYVDAGAYTGGRFFRTTRRAPGSTRGIEIIQADIEPSRRRQLFAPFALEPTSQTGLHHVDGALSMPRWDDPNSATSGVSIMIGENPSLDAEHARDGLGYAVFGRVVRGMDVVHAIHDSPAQGQTLTPPILIRRAYRKEQPR